MNEFELEMKHSESSLMKLSHMQYDLFCSKNKIGRTILSTLVIIIAVVYTSGWFTYVLIAYACYLTTSTYASANRVAHKICDQLKESGMDFPASRFVFSQDGMHIFSLPENEEHGEPLKYSAIAAFGEDRENYYIFRDQYGGYLIPKDKLGDRQGEFRSFIENKTGSVCRKKNSPLRELQNRLRHRENEPYHL